MAYQFEGVCYPDADATLSAMASSLSGSVVDVGGVPYALDVTASGGVLVYSGARLDDVGDFVKNVTVTLQDCQLLTAADALQMAWLVVAVWVAVFAVVLMRRGL